MTAKPGLAQGAFIPV